MEILLLVKKQGSTFNININLHFQQEIFDFSMAGEQKQEIFQLIQLQYIYDQIIIRKCKYGSAESPADLYYDAIYFEHFEY